MSNGPATKTMREELEAHGLEPHEFHLLARALSCSESNAIFEDRLRMLAILGLTELADWITSRKRFDTLSECDIARVLKIFLDIRQEAPSLEALANDFGISEARGHSMLSRMNYGEARRMKAMSYTHASTWLRNELKNIEIKKDRQELIVNAQYLICIKDAAWEIMSDLRDRGKGGKDKDAMRPEVHTKEKQGAIVKTSPKMWAYITAWLDEKAAEMEGAL